jgi:hypothetical protein
LEERFRSSSYSNFLISSGRVTKLLAWRSKDFSFFREYRDLILAGVIELYERLIVSNFSKSSGPKDGMILM